MWVGRYIKMCTSQSDVSFTRPAFVSVRKVARAYSLISEEGGYNNANIEILFALCYQKKREEMTDSFFSNTSLYATFSRKFVVLLTRR